MLEGVERWGMFEGVERLGMFEGGRTPAPRTSPAGGLGKELPASDVSNMCTILGEASDSRAGDRRG